MCGGGGENGMICADRKLIFFSSYAAKEVI